MSAETEARSLVDQVADVLSSPLGNDVREWPADLAAVHRASGYRSFSERNAAVERARRVKDATAVLDWLDAEGRLCDPEACSPEAKSYALAAVTVTDTSGREMLPAEVRVERRPDGLGEWLVILDFGPFAMTLPMSSAGDAEVVAWAFIHLLGGVEYDLSALPEEADGYV